MIDVDYILNRSVNVFGAFLPAEIKALAKTALGYRNAVFVEVGSYFGRSSSVLGMVAKENDCDLTCIDNFTEVPSFSQNREEVKKSFISTMETLGTKYELLDMSSEEASKIYTKEIDLLFIDGNHEYESVKKDISFWVPKVKINGLVLFHDYVGNWVGVKKAVDETTNLVGIDGAESLIIMRKTHE